MAPGLLPRMKIGGTPGGVAAELTAGHLEAASRGVEKSNLFDKKEAFHHFVVDESPSRFLARDTGDNGGDIPAWVEEGYFGFSEDRRRPPSESDGPPRTERRHQSGWPYSVLS